MSSLEHLETRKAAGNELFKAGEYQQALDIWQEALKDLVGLLQHRREAGRESLVTLPILGVKDLERSLYLNVAAAFAKLRDPGRAIRACEAVLLGEPSHPKALYRKASSQLDKGDFKDAEATLRRLLEAEPQNAAAVKLLAGVKAAAHAEKDRAKAIARKVCSGGVAGYGEGRVADSPADPVATELDPERMGARVEMAELAAAAGRRRQQGLPPAEALKMRPGTAGSVLAALGRQGAPRTVVILAFVTTRVAMPFLEPLLARDVEIYLCDMESEEGLDIAAEYGVDEGPAVHVHLSGCEPSLRSAIQAPALLAEGLNVVSTAVKAAQTEAQQEVVKEEEVVAEEDGQAEVSPDLEKFRQQVLGRTGKYTAHTQRIAKMREKARRSGHLEFLRQGGKAEFSESDLPADWAGFQAQFLQDFEQEAGRPAPDLDICDESESCAAPAVSTEERASSTGEGQIQVAHVARDPGSFAIVEEPARVVARVWLPGCGSIAEVDVDAGETEVVVSCSSLLDSVKIPVPAGVDVNSGAAKWSGSKHELRLTWNRQG
mmetsp:Transcript_53195/g.116744  ORF Transcript_53195/g.116744 Transcript_53195/m.116744 type:complete len:546 (+) Transcript_53195:38-1675(+)